MENFKISYFPRTQNESADSLSRNAPLTDVDPAFRGPCSVARENILHFLWYSGSLRSRKDPLVSSLPSNDRLMDPKLETEDDQVIEALNDMDITDQLDGGLMDCEMQNDDLMGLELAEMKDKTGHDRAGHVADQKSKKLAVKSSRHSKHGSKLSVSLGIQKKKFKILLRGSPQKRSSSSLVARAPGGTGGSRRHHHSLKKQKTGSSKRTPRSLAFNTLTEQDPKLETEDDQVIEALNDMDITDQLDGGLMDCEMQNDDLMGLELAKMKDKTGHDRAGHVAD
ncbi:hypothetical protein Bca52824_059553 [Brassica carinata]|uniref:Uncharacterized protein n=1 Tax=Brassica carinata TaxID=52824 RepID=A0A8X7QUN1_BRACI|nr:hypothetical protein Bca52824_059553 [Brassica carinata]